MGTPEDYQAIAQRIKQRRTELNLSLQDIADITDMSKSTLQRYEAGSIRNIPLQKLGILARALQTSADWLLGWTKGPEDISPIDMDFRQYTKVLGFRIHSWPGSDSKIYLSNDDIGQAQITKEEYEQFRDSITAYIKFNATNLLQQALSRENQRILEEFGKLEQEKSNPGATNIGTKERT